MGSTEIQRDQSVDVVADDNVDTEHKGTSSSENTKDDQASADNTKTNQDPDSVSHIL